MSVNMKTIRGMPDSICWDCANAVANETCGCSWSRYEEPIEGWLTYKFEDEKDKGRERVILCPQFTPDEKRPLDGEDGNFKALGIAIITQAAKDYSARCKEWLEHEDEYIEALRIREERDRAADYKNKISQRYRYNPRRPWETSKTYSLILASWAKLSAKYRPYLLTAEKAMFCESEMRDCERFFMSDTMMLYADLNGEYLINLIRKRTMDMMKTGERSMRLWKKKT